MIDLKMRMIIMAFEKSIFNYQAIVLVGTSKQIEDRLNEINTSKELSLVFTSNLEKVNADEQGNHIFAIVIQTKKIIRGFGK